MLDAVLVRDDLPELGAFIRGVYEDKITQRGSMRWAYRSGFRTVDRGGDENLIRYTRRAKIHHRRA